MRVHPFQVAAILLAFAAYVPAENPPDQPDNAGSSAATPPPPPHRGGGQMLGLLDRLSAYAESPADDKDADAKWAATEEHLKKNKEQFARMDTDGDGHISRTEAAAAVAMIAAKIKDKSPELFDKIDTNGDGKLSHDEIKAALEAMHKDHPPGGHPPGGDGPDGPPPGHGDLPPGPPPGNDGGAPPASAPGSDR